MLAAAVLQLVVFEQAAEVLLTVSRSFVVLSAEFVPLVDYFWV